MRVLAPPPLLLPLQAADAKFLELLRQAGGEDSPDKNNFDVWVSWLTCPLPLRCMPASVAQALCRCLPRCHAAAAHRWLVPAAIDLQREYFYDTWVARDINGHKFQCACRHASNPALQLRCCTGAGNTPLAQPTAKACTAVC